MVQTGRVQGCNKLELLTQLLKTSNIASYKKKREVCVGTAAGLLLALILPSICDRSRVVSLVILLT